MIRLCFSPVKEDVLALVIVVHPLVLKFHLNHCQKQQNRKQNPAICGSRTHFIVTEAALINAFNHHHCRAKRATIGGHDHNLRKQLEGVNQADNQDKEKRRSQQWQCNSNINTIISNDIQKVWNIVLAVDKYNSWRSDLSKTEIINDKQFIEYTKNGYATTFTVTVVEPYKRWEFDMDNSNMKGHWIGIFTDKGNETQIDFTENVIPKKWFMKPFVKTYLKKQQKQFVLDLKKALE